MKEKQKEHFIYARVPESIKNMAARKAKKLDLSVTKWIKKVIKEAK